MIASHISAHLSAAHSCYDSLVPSYPKGVLDSDPVAGCWPLKHTKLFVMFFINCGHELSPVSEVCQESIAIAQLHHDQHHHFHKHHYYSSSSLDCWHKTGWVHGFMLSMPKFWRYHLCASAETEIWRLFFFSSVLNCPVFFVVVVFWWELVPICSLTFLVLADRSGICCGLLLFVAHPPQSSTFFCRFEMLFPLFTAAVKSSLSEFACLSDQACPGPFSSWHLINKAFPSAVLPLAGYFFVFFLSKL